MCLLDFMVRAKKLHTININTKHSPTYWAERDTQLTASKSYLKCPGDTIVRTPTKPNRFKRKGCNRFNVLPPRPDVPPTSTVPGDKIIRIWHKHKHHIDHAVHRLSAEYSTAVPSTPSSALSISASLTATNLRQQRWPHIPSDPHPSSRSELWVSVLLTAANVVATTTRPGMQS